MIEILFIFLLIWIFYAWKAGKFSKKMQEKNREELKRDWNKFKQHFKTGFKNHKAEPVNYQKDEISKPILSQKQRELQQKQILKYAEELEKKHGTRCEVIDENNQKDRNEYNWLILKKSNQEDYISNTLPDISFYRYVLEYKDASGNITIRGIDISLVYKGYQNTRWYFKADTDDGERTFKSQRVMRLKDQWTATTYETAREVREHILSEHRISESIFDDEE